MQTHIWPFCIRGSFGRQVCCMWGVERVNLCARAHHTLSGSKKLPGVWKGSIACACLCARAHQTLSSSKLRTGRCRPHALVIIVHPKKYLSAWRKVLKFCACDHRTPKEVPYCVGCRVGSTSCVGVHASSTYLWGGGVGLGHALAIISYTKSWYALAFVYFMHQEELLAELSRNPISLTLLLLLVQLRCDLDPLTMACTA